MVEQGTHKPLVVGPNPTLATNHENFRYEPEVFGLIYSSIDTITPEGEVNMKKQSMITPAVLIILTASAFTLFETGSQSIGNKSRSANPETSTPTPEGKTGLSRADYLALDVQKALIDRETRIKMDEQYLRDLGKPDPYIDLRDSSVYDAALNLAGYPNVDGMQPDRVTIEFSDSDMATAYVFDEKLMDDSIYAHEYRVELYLKEGIWKVNWAGVRYQCARGETSGWTTNLCP